MVETWFILIIFSVLVGAVGEIGQKLSVSSKEDISAETVNFWVSIVQGTLSLIFLLTFVDLDFDASLTNRLVLQLIIGSVLGFFFFKFLYTSYKGNSASISQVIFSLSVVASATLGIILFDEATAINKFLGIGMIILAVSIASFKKQKLTKYNFYALLAALIYGVLTNIDKSFATTLNVHYYQVLGVFAFSMASIFFSGKKIINETPQITHDVLKSILISAIAFTIFNKLTYLAYSMGGEVGKVDALNNTVIILILVFEVLILKDRSNLKRKIVATCLAVSGVLLLGFFS